ncbi:MAG: GNAT family N-acetyltransferase [Frankiaceae bacterium]|nr:GNAT family N-acetyltransferase [Frankiaceae bacterium]
MPEEMTAEDAVALIEAGDRVFVGSACAVPRTLLAALEARRPLVPGVRLVHFLADGTGAAYPQEVFFVGSALRGKVSAGKVDYVPLSSADLPALIAGGQQRVDVALIQVAPPDENGMCSLGVSVDVTLAAALAARLVIAEVNPAMPRTGPSSTIPADRIAAFVLVDARVTEYLHEPVGEAAAGIAPYVARLVPDGATLQIGLGRVPNEMLQHLRGRRDLRVHSDVVTDGLVDLLEAGVVRDWPGSVVASMAVGTKRLFDRLSAPIVDFRPIEKICGLRALTSVERMVSVTQAFAVDLTGQVCADTDDGVLYGGVAAQPVMHYAASRSPGGRAIVCLSTEFPDGSSRIRSVLEPDEAVTIPRADVHYVTTEYGTAYLFGRSLRDRAVALIEVAHPRHRDSLLAAAVARGLVPAGQTLRSRGPYPGSEERTVVLRDGAVVLLRPARTGDALALQDLFYRMPPHDVYTRFFRHLTTLPLSTAEHLTSVSFEDEVTFLAVVGDWGSEQIVGTASYFLDRVSGTADVAYIVDPSYKGLGLGTALQERLVSYARSQGVRAFTADVLHENKAMLRLFESSGLEPQFHTTQGVTEVILTL